MGKNAPETLEKYENLKYNSDEWKKFQTYAKSIQADELTPLADFELYKKIDLEIDEKLVGKTAPNGIKVTEKTDHFIARIIGSIVQRRNGVPVEDALKLIMDQSAIVLPVRTGVDGLRSQKIRGENIELTINPDTGYLIQTNPYIGGKKK